MEWKNTIGKGENGMYILVAVAAGIGGMIAHDKKCNRLKILCYVIALAALCLGAIDVWVGNFSAVM